MDFSTGGSILWIIDSFCFVLFFVQKQRFEVKDVLMDLFLTNMHLFTSQDVNWWTGVVWITCVLLWCFYQLFGTHSLQRIHWWASDGMLHFSKSVPMRKQAHLRLGWSEGKYILSNFIFLVKYSFHTVNNVLLLSVDLLIEHNSLCSCVRHCLTVISQR